MKPRYSKRTVDEAVQLLDVYASQAAPMNSLPALRIHLGLRVRSCVLAIRSRGWIWPWATFADRQHDALEAAQRLREGWRP